MKVVKNNMKQVVNLRLVKNNRSNNSLVSGFTIIELLLVIAIIAVLSTLFVNYFPSAQKRARDAQRRNDLRQYDQLLRTFAVKNQGFYPGSTTDISASDYVTSGPVPVNLCTLLSESSCPHDPKDNSQCKTGTCRYYFNSNNCNTGASCATLYVLHARLENENGSLVMCSNGKTGIAAEGTSFSSGTCPL